MTIQDTFFKNKALRLTKVHLLLFFHKLEFQLFTMVLSRKEFKGGNDPFCREPLWTSMDTNTEMYTFLKTIISVRKQKQWWKYD